MKRINIHIDRIMLRGFRADDKQGIAEGVQSELARIFSNPESVQNITTHSNTARLRISNVQIGQNAKPQSIGRQVAQGIGKGIRK